MFIFSLRTLLKIKEDVEKEKKTIYARSLSKLDGLKAELNNLEDSLLLIYKDNKQGLKKTIQPATLRMYNNYIALLKRNIQQKIHDIGEQEKVTEKHRQEMIKANIERKTIDKLKEKEYEQYLIEENKKDQKMIDQLVSYKYSSK